MDKKENIVRTKGTWQKKLLPLMTWLLVGLTIFFFFASFYQLYYLHAKIENGPQIDLNQAIKLSEDKIKNNEQEQLLQIIQWKTLATLDEHTLNQRYHQANVLLMARIWTRYLCFVTGMILCLVGASFILGKIEQAETVVDGKNPLVDFSIKTSSPGLVLALLGTVLMMTSVLVHNEIKVTDGPAYLHLKFLSGFAETNIRPNELKLNNADGSNTGTAMPNPSEEERQKYSESYKELNERLRNRQADNKENVQLGGEQ